MAKSFSITGALKNTKILSAKIQALQVEALSRQVQAVQEGTFLVHENAVKLIQDNNDGRPQIRYSPKRVVAVSRPGTPPNTDTGRLVQSIKFDFQKGGLIGRIGSNLKYARDLEFGTKNMEARPWLSTAVSMATREIADIFRRAIKGLTK